MRQIRDILEEAYDFHRAGDLSAAEAIYERLLGYCDEPDVNVLASYGTLAAQQEKYGLAADLLRRAVTAYPQHPSAWTNLGIALKKLDREEAADFCLLKGCEVAPDEAINWSNIAGYWTNRGEAKKAEEYARKAIALDPSYPEAHNHLGLALLEQERYAEAWEHYEWRWQVKERLKDNRPYNAPKWKGERVETLAIHGEQAIGDEILFCGCLREVQKRVGRVIIEVTPRLVPIFQQAFGVPCYPDHATLIAAEGEPDAFISMGTLAAIVGLPDGRPYLPRPYPAIPGRVGIAWKGGLRQTSKKFRTQKLEALRPILDLGLDFISVQYDGEKEAKEQDLPHAIEGKDLRQIHDEISRCELVITCCQTAVHQAGAMGIEAWVMTPKACAWRYAGNSERMQWYNSVRLFRQGNDESWAPVISRIVYDLKRRFGREEAA